MGTGEDITILDLAQLIGQDRRLERRAFLDPSMPDGTTRKLLDVSRLASLAGERPISPPGSR